VPPRKPEAGRQPAAAARPRRGRADDAPASGNPPARPLPAPAWASADGHSRLWPGDQAELFASLPDESVDCIWTDPPYFLSNDGSTCRSGKRDSVNKGAWDRSQGLSADDAFTEAWLSECRRVLKTHGSLWVSGTLHGYLLVGGWLQRLGFRILNDIVWEKPNPPPNLGCRCFTHSTELVFWAAKPDARGQTRHVFHYEAMRAQADGRQMKNVWRLPAPGAAEKRHGRHPTQKPLGLVERALLASTHPGDLVLDPFSGSGTTGVAALNTGRRFIGFEQDAHFTDLAARRLEEAQADAARREATGALEAAKLAGDLA
jgi:site-specific DNA-methyltransferase (adenine-specific)